MRHMENRTEHPSYDEYIDILFEKIKSQSNEIRKLYSTHKEYKNKTRQLNELKDLTPDARKIISTMMLL